MVGCITLQPLGYGRAINHSALRKAIIKTPILKEFRHIFVLGPLTKVLTEIIRNEKNISTP